MDMSEALGTIFLILLVVIVLLSTGLLGELLEAVSQALCALRAGPSRMSGGVRNPMEAVSK